MEQVAGFSEMARFIILTFAVLAMVVGLLVLWRSFRTPSTTTLATATVAPVVGSGGVADDHKKDENPKDHSGDPVSLRTEPQGAHQPADGGLGTAQVPVTQQLHEAVPVVAPASTGQATSKQAE